MPVNTNSNVWDIPAILELLRNAGNLSLEYWRGNALNTQFKEDHSPVTEGDRAVEALYAQALLNPSKGHYLIGEESIESQPESYVRAALEAPATWIVDPIDGTAPFANKLPMFGSCIGLMEHGKFTNGAFILPLSGDVWITCGTEVLTASGLNLSQPFEFEKFAPLVRCETPDSMVTLSQLVTKYGQYRGPERVQSICSCVFTLGHLLRGAYKGYIGAGKIWDFAAAIPLFRNAGGFVRKLHTPGPLGDTPHDIFSTEADAPKRWGVRDHLIFAMSESDADAFASNTTLTH